MGGGRGVEYVKNSESYLTEERKDAVGSGTKGMDLTVDNSSLTTEQLRINKGNILFHIYMVYNFIFKVLIQDFCWGLRIEEV